MTEGVRRWEGHLEEEWRRRLNVDVVRFIRSTKSTNDDAMALPFGPSGEIAVIVADEQTSGRGTRGRPWSSPPKTSLSMTLVRPFVGSPSSVLPLLVGLGLARGMEEVVPGFSTQLKWPNDLLLGGKKVGGILCEAREGRLVIGVGVNVNQAIDDFPESLRETASSLSIQAGHPVPRGSLLLAVIPRIKRVLLDTPAVLAAEDLQELDRRNPIRGQRITVSGVANTPNGGVVRLDQANARAGRILVDGALEVLAEDGSSLHLVSGSLRPSSGVSSNPITR